jgi:hypothetical protein
MLIGNLFHLLIVCFINGERDDLSTAQAFAFSALGQVQSLSLPNIMIPGAGFI